jgi:hypothetical protein
MQSVAAIQARPAAVAVRPARRQSVRVMAASAGQEVRTFVLEYELSWRIVILVCKDLVRVAKFICTHENRLDVCTGGLPEDTEPLLLASIPGSMMFGIVFHILWDV